MPKHLRRYWWILMIPLVVVGAGAVYVFLSISRNRAEAEAAVHAEAEGRAEADRDIAAGMLKIKFPSRGDNPIFQATFAELVRERFGATVEVVAEGPSNPRIKGYQDRVWEEVKRRHGPDAFETLLRDSAHLANQRTMEAVTGKK